MIIKNERKKYASDLTDSQWEMITPLFPPAGNKSKWEKRELVDAVLYLVAVEKYSSIQRFCADAGYRKTFENDVADILGLGVDISEPVPIGLNYRLDGAFSVMLR